MDKKTLLIPFSIIIAGAILAVSVYFINKAPVVQTTGVKGESVTVRPTDSTDHILGSPNAKIKLIEYSDFECPHCKTYHETLQIIIDQYGANGDVAWVFRQFPIAQLHSKAPKESEASECVAELKGNDAFWKFTDKIFAVTPSDNNLDLTKLPDLAVQSAGVDRAQFIACLDSGKYAEKIQKSIDEGVKAGVRGTPHIFIEAGGEFLPLEGAQPLSSLRSAIDVVLGQLGKNSPTPAQ